MEHTASVLEIIATTNGFAVYDRTCRGVNFNGDYTTHVPVAVFESKTALCKFLSDGWTAEQFYKPK